MKTITTNQQYSLHLKSDRLRIGRKEVAIYHIVTCEGKHGWYCIDKATPVNTIMDIASIVPASISESKAIASYQVRDYCSRHHEPMAPIDAVMRYNA